MTVVLRPKKVSNTTTLTKLVETKAISAHISQFPCMDWKHRQYCRNAFPPPSPHSMLLGRTEVSSGELWWQNNIDKGERGTDLSW